MVVGSRKFVLHSRVESSLRMAPGLMVWWYPGDTEAVVIESHLVFSSWSTCSGTVLQFLKQYDFRGSNRYQEEENLEFLRLYGERYPQIWEHLPNDILQPTDWKEGE